MLIDTHCHLNLLAKKNFDERLLTNNELANIKKILNESQQAEVFKILTVGTTVTESKNCIAIAQTYHEVFASIGLHPTDVTSNWRTELKELQNLLKVTPPKKIVAIGETGIDLYHKKDTVAIQKDAFRAQIELALSHDLALIVHTRNAPEETLDCLTQYKNEQVRGVIHCYSQNSSFAQEAIELGYVLGIGGPLTYPKNNYLREIFASINLNHIVLETDAPFLPPQYIRGQENHPKEIRTIAQYLAQIRNITIEQVAQKTTENAERIFRFQLSETNS
ncbi:MAG TPA: TatD family hydrolase [Candidatus Babeliales bacterium]|nr:TatD family hydrolase [Candidatus Babeliales bacterium]